ncbi:MAG: c-type cytochrome [Acidobacteriota bacterium]|nr:c-type cytochrome [Acidobacteriota bacterium]
MIWLAALFLLQRPQTLDVEIGARNPHTTQADIEQGKRLFAGRCAGCHGPTGDGGKGANLAVPVLPRTSDDRSLYRTIRYGIPDTEMPSSLMSPREIWQVAAFVRTLGQLQRDPVRGDAARGYQLARGKGGCLQCHAIGLAGGRIGPALTDIGLRMSPSHLRAKLVDPGSNVPDQFRIVDLKTRDGQAVSGVRLNEDTWSIQVRDFDDKLHSFWKQDLLELKVDRRTVMPSYRTRFAEQEIDDITAYLTALGGLQ